MAHGCASSSFLPSGRGPTTEYELLLSSDPSSKKHVQWFYFSVANMKVGVRYRFHIANFSKRYSMYQVCVWLVAENALPCCYHDFDLTWNGDTLTMLCLAVRNAADILLIG